MSKRIPTLREITSSREPARAAWWRKHVIKLSADELSKLTGFSARAIWLFEAGCNNNGKPHETKSLQRYRMACAGVDAALRGKRKFTWGIENGGKDA